MLQSCSLNPPYVKLAHAKSADATPADVNSAQNKAWKIRHSYVRKLPQKPKNMCLQGDALKYIVHSLKHYIKHILKSERPHFLWINAEVPSMWTKKNKILQTDSFFWYILFYGTCILLSRTLPNSLKEPSLFCLSTNQSTPLITTCEST